MRKFKSYSTSLLILSVLFIGFSSCKKCKIDGDNIDSGVIVEDVKVYPKSGYVTIDMNSDYHVHGGSSVSGKFEMSTDDGFTKSPFNYTEYSILAYPMTLNCNHFLERNVKIDDDNMTATYIIKVVQCREAKCKEQRYIENYVVVPAIPSSYTILRDVEIIEQ